MIPNPALALGTRRTTRARVVALVAACSLTAAWIAPAAAAAPVIGLTQVGSPIWKPGDFQMFTAPADPFPGAFFATLDSLLPLEGSGVPAYTPHAGPYATELSTNAAAAGIVNQQVFPTSAITLNPNGVYFMFMMLPDPGVMGSSRDFASGPIIPNSLFPMSTHSEMWIDGVSVETLQDGAFNIRAGDEPFDGASSRHDRSSATADCVKLLFSRFRETNGRRRRMERWIIAVRQAFRPDDAASVSPEGLTPIRRL